MSGLSRREVIQIGQRLTGGTQGALAHPTLSSDGTALRACGDALPDTRSARCGPVSRRAARSSRLTTPAPRLACPSRHRPTSHPAPDHSNASPCGHPPQTRALVAEPVGMVTFPSKFLSVRSALRPGRSLYASQPWGAATPQGALSA